MRFNTSCIITSILFATQALASPFLPRIGDEAVYELTQPLGSGTAKRSLLSYDQASDTYQMSVTQDVQGKVQQQIEAVPGPKIRASYISDLSAFCSERAGTIETTTFDGKPIQACHLIKDDKVFRQDDWWVAGIPFGNIHSIKKSPLHPKAGTTTRLLFFTRQGQ